MQKTIYKLIIIFAVVMSAGCAYMPKLPKWPKMPALHIPGLYSVGKANIAIADFEMDKAKLAPGIAAGLRQMFIGALSSNSRFSIVEWKPGQTDLLIRITVNDFQPQASGGRAGIGGGGGIANGAMGGLLGGSLNNAYMALDIRIIDPDRSRTIAATTIQSSASDTAEGFLSNIELGEGLSVFANTAMEKAMRLCISEAARYVNQSIKAGHLRR